MFSVCVCINMYAFTQILSGIPDSQILTHIPRAAGSVSAPRQAHFHTSSAEKVRATVEESIFSLRLALHEYFTQATRFSAAAGVCRGEISDKNLASRHHLLTVTGLPTGWSWCRDRGLVKPPLTVSVCISARPANGIHFAVVNHQYKSKHTLALLIVCCVRGWRGWASLWTYQAFHASNKA